MPFRRSSERPAGRPAVSVHEAALRLLARRAYSRRELTQRLEARGHTAAVVRDELRRLEAAGLLDDEAVAGAVVASQLARGRGRRAVEVELRRRGLGRDMRAATLDGLAPEDEAAALARAVATATARHVAWRQLPQARRKVVRYLLARGFDPGQVRDALDRRAETDHEEHDADDLRDP